MTMKTNRIITQLAAASMALSGLVACSHATADPGEAPLKPRIVIMTDIGPGEVEPDDMESAVRLLSYADRFEIEAIITTIGWNCDPYPSEWADYLKQVIDGYSVDVNNLMKRSDQECFRSLEEESGKQELGYWPSVDYIRSRAMMGSQRAGIAVIGEDNDTPGSDMIIKLADEEDDRPIWLCAWGGANTLSQAIWRVQQTRSEDEFKAFLHKLRLYTITDQDMVYAMRMDRAYSSHMWLRREFPEDLMLVWDESAWLNQNSMGVQNWDRYAELIQGHGAMGSVYPHYLWGVEGDTPSFLNVMPNGLNDPNDPEQVGWGGCHHFGISPDGETYAWTNWQEPLRSVSRSYEQVFYYDEFNDFAARMQWAAEGDGNVNPIVSVTAKGGSEGLAGELRLTAQRGKAVRLDASPSYDPDGDAISFKWWQQPDAGSSHTEIPVSGEGSIVSISIPEDCNPGTLHYVCEVHDDGPFSLVAYKRIIIEVK